MAAAKHFTYVILGGGVAAVTSPPSSSTLFNTRLPSHGHHIISLTRSMNSFSF
jgi:hypothetical protein